MRYFFAIFGLLCVATVSILGIRGTKFKDTPLWIFPDMDFQAKYLPQGRNEFFNDYRNDRPVVNNTIARGYGWDRKAVFASNHEYKEAKNPSMYSGKDVTGAYIKDFPIAVDEELMKLGQHKYAVTCIVCHGESGDGNGITKSYGMIATVSYHDERIRTMPIGEIFNTITHGKGQMNTYADKLSPYERWAVIAYVRALQRSQNATIADVPAEFKTQLGL